MMKFVVALACVVAVAHAGDKYQKVDFTKLERGCVDINDCKNSESVHELNVCDCAGDVSASNHFSGGSCIQSRTGCEDSETLARATDRHFWATDGSVLAGMDKMFCR